MASSRNTASMSKRPALPVTPSCSRRSPPTRSISRIGSGPALAFVAKGNPETRHCGDGQSAAAARSQRPEGRAGQERRRSERQDDQRLDGGFARPNGSCARPRASRAGDPTASRSPISARTRRRSRRCAAKNVDGFVADVALAYKLEEEGISRILVRFGNIVSDFHIHVIYATQQSDRDAAERHQRLPRRLVRHHRLYSPEQAGYGRHGFQAHEHLARDREPDLRRRHAHVL